MKLKSKFETQLIFLNPMLDQMSSMDQAETLEEIEEIAPKLLTAIAQFACADGAAVYRKKESVSNCYVPISCWAKEGKTYSFLSEIDLEVLPVTRTRFENQKPLIFDQETKDDEMMAERALFCSASLKTVMLIPIIAQKKFCGFLKLNDVALPMDKQIFKIISSIINHWGAISVRVITNLFLQRQQERLEDALRVEKKYSDIFSALTKVYWQIYSLNLKTNMYIEVFNGLNYNKDNDMRSDGITKEGFQMALERFVADAYKGKMIEFLDNTTLSKRLANTESISMEYLAKNGLWLSACYIVQSRDEDGNVTEALFAIQSVNEHKQKELSYQERLKRVAEEAKRANLAKMDFLRRMSHDLRTPINGIRGMLEISNRFPNDVQKLQEYRKKMWDASGYLLNLINSILDMNKLESGQLVADHSSFNLLESLQNIYTIISTQATEKGLKISSDTSQIIHSHLIGSPLYLNQILINVVNNAVKYTPAGGTIELSCKEEMASKEYSKYCFVIRDTGIGMSSEFQAHVYEAFSQEHSQIFNGYAGTGLGLAITKQLVEFLNGTIDFESKPGKGTTFRIDLPFQIDYAEQAEKKRKSTTFDLSGKKILLVEDNELNLEIAKFILEDAGAQVGVAQNGQEAVARFREASPFSYALILMDIMMPIMNGYEATKAIRSMARPDSRMVPIIAMSANAFQDDIAESKRVGMNEHLSKPLDSVKLLNSIAKYM